MISTVIEQREGERNVWPIPILVDSEWRIAMLEVVACALACHAWVWWGLRSVMVGCSMHQ